MTLVAVLLIRGGVPSSVSPGSPLPGSRPDSTALTTRSAESPAGTGEWGKAWRIGGKINPVRPPAITSYLSEERGQYASVSLRKEGF